MGEQDDCPAYFRRWLRKLHDVGVVHLTTTIDWDGKAYKWDGDLTVPVCRYVEIGDAKANEEESNARSFRLQTKFVINEMDDDYVVSLAERPHSILRRASTRQQAEAWVAQKLKDLLEVPNV